jgi:RNase P subunit RPR2
MALDKDTVDKFTKFINEKWKTKICPICQANSWSFNGYMVFGLGDELNKIPIGDGKAMPCVSVVCLNCGNTIFINAFLAGLGVPT